MANIQRLFFIPQELSDRIDAWCKENDSNFSRFMRMAARSTLNMESGGGIQSLPTLVNLPQTSPEPQQALPEEEKVVIPFYCDVRGCKSESVGNFRVTTSGLDTKDMYLCKFHLSIAKREGEVREV